MRRATFSKDDEGLLVSHVLVPRRGFLMLADDVDIDMVVWPNHGCLWWFASVIGRFVGLRRVAEHWYL